MKIILTVIAGAIAVLVFTFLNVKRDERLKYEKLETIEQLKKLSTSFSNGESKAEDRKEWEKHMRKLEGLAFKGSDAIDKFYREMKEQYQKYMAMHHSSKKM